MVKENTKELVKHLLKPEPTTYLKWKDLPPQVKGMYLFLFKEFMEGMSYIPGDEEGVGSITAYLKDIISTHNELMYKKFEFLSFLGPKNDGEALDE